MVKVRPSKLEFEIGARQSEKKKSGYFGGILKTPVFKDRKLYKTMKNNDKKRINQKIDRDDVTLHKIVNT